MHADEGKVGRVADHGCDTAGSKTGAGALAEGYLSVGFLGVLVEGFDEGLEEAHSGCGVDSLAQKTGGETGVKVQGLSADDDVAGDTEGGGARAGAGTFTG